MNAVAFKAISFVGEMDDRTNMSAFRRDRLARRLKAGGSELGAYELLAHRDGWDHSHSLPTSSSSSRSPCPMPIMVRPHDISPTTIA
jgi:hypothetical protein